MVSEFHLIDKIKNLFNSSFIGDDCAFLKEENILVSKDLLIEGTHFILNNNFYEVGYKSLIANISDILANGGRPKYFLLGLGIRETYLNYLDDFLNGLKKVADKFNLSIIGGDITKSQQFFISITIIGHPFNNPIKRNNAKINDDIFITGNIGDSYIGLQIIKKQINIEKEQAKYFYNKHFFPEVNCNLIKFIEKISEEQLINSMIDISDGFIQDLSHILMQSNKSAIIYPLKIPVSQNYQYLKKILTKDYYKIPLISGEEYQLIFTASQKNEKKLKQIANIGKIKITKVGEIIEKDQELITFKDIKLDLKTLKGYDHFAI